MVQLTPATQHLQGSLYFFAQPQLTSCFSALTWISRAWNQSASPNVMDRDIAGCGMSALPQTSPLGMKLEERDDEVHHGLDASGRNMILNRATYTCTIITIISPLTDETEVLLNARHSTQPSPRCLAWSCLSILWCCRSNYYVVALTYERNRRCPPYLIVCIGYSVESHGQTISASITCQWHGGVLWDPQDYRPSPHVLICHVFQ